jgi:hypothetical protein
MAAGDQCRELGVRVMGATQGGHQLHHHLALGCHPLVSEAVMECQE